jgi:glycyl-tRNA synthetase beta chain
MSELLFEIGVEELPAHSLDPAIAFMAEFFKTEMANKGLKLSGISVEATPRRLVLMCENLATMQADCEEEVMGPSVNVAYEKPGVLSKAGLGFIKAKGLDESALYLKKTDKGDVIAAKLSIKGQETAALLPAVLLDMMRKIPFKKRMRWESSGDSFARPIRWMVALFNGEILALKFADVESGSQSFGHRFLSPAPFVVTSNAQYLSELKKRSVIISQSERARLIEEQAQARVSAVGGRLLEDPELMDTVKNLVENPFVIVGSFDERYLAIPKEILISEMKTHQKCFAVYDAQEKLLPYFVCVAGTLPHDEKVFAAGNARVLRARFEDGAFYFAEDQKKTLSEHAEALATVVFERELGTVQEKAQRIERIAGEIASLLRCSEGEIKIIKEAAPLLKADLVTGVVGQFPELQGIMGAIYAANSGSSTAVCEAIRTHYWPRFSEDSLPPNKAASILSLADKLDTLVGITAIGKGPKGNKDPFALRRNAIAIVRIIVEFEMPIELPILIELALRAFGEKFAQKAASIREEVRDFMVQRARGLLIDELGREQKDLAVSFADSVLAVGSNDMLDVFLRAQTLFSMRRKNPDSFDSLVQTIKRASNIVKKAISSGEKFTESNAGQTLTLACEIDLIIAVEQVNKFGVVGRTHYSDLLSGIALIKPKLDAFFDGVMVMVEDEKLKNARLNLLGVIKQMADKIADFTHL